MRACNAKVFTAVDCFSGVSVITKNKARTMSLRPEYQSLAISNIVRVYVDETCCSSLPGSRKNCTESVNRSRCSTKAIFKFVRGKQLKRQTSGLLQGLRSRTKVVSSSLRLHLQGTLAYRNVTRCKYETSPRL